MTADSWMRTTSRRGFLAGAAGLAIAAACGGDDDDGAANRNGDDIGLGVDDLGTQRQADAAIQGGVATPDLWTGEELRVPFGILREAEGGFEELIGPAVTIGFQGPEGASVAPKAASLRNRGLQGSVHDGIYTIDVTFPAAGRWAAIVDVEGEEGIFAFEVNEDPLNPIPGDDAVVAPSPTADEPLGVDPICTREPQCPLHEVSLDDALAQDRPTVVMFATPARCTSRWCGPVLDVLLDVMGPYRDAMNLIHVEIFKDLQTTDSVPTVAEWNLANEPIVYGIDAGGSIAARLDGAFDAEEVEGLLQTLTA